MVHRWGEAALRTGGLLSAQQAKTCYLHDPGDKVIEENFTDYFRNLRPLATEWRDLVKEEDTRRARVKNDQPPLSHQTIISLLRQHVDNLPSSGDLASPNTPPIIPHPRT